jgi:release factor glutamine methyltransferase
MTSAPDTDDSWTVRRLLGWTQERFESVGIESPRVDAEHLLSFALACSRMSLYLDHDKVVQGPERARFRELVKRRLGREPVAYIEGKRGFHALGLELHVDRRVLIPRPETELLVDWVLEELVGPRTQPAWEDDVAAHGDAFDPSAGATVEPVVVLDDAGLDRSADAMEEPVVVLDDDVGLDHGANVMEEPVVVLDEPEPSHGPATDAAAEASATPTSRSAVPELTSPPPDERAVLDVGTGSGAIALALKHARPSLRVTACDLSEDALAVARENAERLELAIRLLRSDLLADVPTPESGWSVITANLPYIREPVWRTLAPEVQRFEPRLALDGGEDGLDLIRRLVATAPARLAPGGALYLEIGFDQGESVPELLAAHGYVDVAVRKDYAGHPRIVRGRRGA